MRKRILRSTASTNEEKPLKPASFLDGKKILVTGATGLIGKALIRKILTEKAPSAKVMALVRNREKAERCFSDLLGSGLEIMACDVCDLKPADLGVDYIVHGASFTASKSFVETPVDVIACSIRGTQRVLGFAAANHAKGVVYLSSMEVYGSPQTDDKVYENSPAYLDTMQVRSSYPESKRLCENLCASYFSQFQVPAKVIRLTQTFGEGVAYRDNRVFAEFARCAIEGKDIVLKSKGETKRNYLYVGDAAEAILTVLEKGRGGEAYNACNEDTYCSIREMADLVVNEIAKGKIAIRYDLDGGAHSGYAPVLKMNLSSEKLRALGWTPTIGLKSIFERMIESMIKERARGAD